MNFLNADDINKFSPYMVTIDPVTGFLYFVTKNGTQLTIDFSEDDLIHSAECYQLSINNANNRPSPRDINVQKTITAQLKTTYKQYTFSRPARQSALRDFFCPSDISGDGK